MKNFRLSFTLVLLTWMSIMNLNAGLINPHTAIQTNYGGSPVVIGTSTAECSTFVPTNALMHWNKTVVNRIGFEVDYNYQDYFSSIQDVKIKLYVKRKNMFNNLITPMSDTVVYLRVKYIPNIDSNQWAKNYCQFINAYEVTINIDSIYVNGSSVTTLPANLRITNDIFIDRVYYFTDYNNSDYGLANDPLIPDCGETPRTIRISWDANPQITEYQLEWMHVNDYGFDPQNPNATNPNPISPQALAYNFRKNSTRISTTNSYFDLNLVFNRGWIVYRIRGVGFYDSNDQNETYGVWSIPDEGNVGDVSTDQRFQITDAIAHENTLNWQYAATYAEEGKHKEVISYFDGSLRNRQSVTKINSDKNTIVGETIYDHQGRPAIQVLPVPVPEESCSGFTDQALRFYPNFNLYDDGNAPDAYNRLNFDIDKNGCDVTADPMSTESGASNYYSTFNENKEDAQGYVPDAKKYPFTQVEYTPDNTGRIRRQSGVGEEFKLGNNHETEYLYGQPNQVVLDRLFGAEVGYANHYKENAVIDANGQVSISYLDQEGRVIATALAAESPESFKELSSAEAAAVPLTVNAFGNDNNQNLVLDESIHFYKELLVTNPSDYKFTYDFEIAPLVDECLPNYCINCIYVLEIKLLDECGVNLFPEDLEQKITGQFTYNSETETYVFHATCESPINYEFEQEIIVSLPIGSYSLTKTLTVNNDARQAYIDLYLAEAEGECLKDLNDFIEEEMASIDLSGCEVSCEECKENLGSLEEFITTGEGSANDYFAAAKDCDQLCNSETISLCDVTRKIMEMDMAPGGQYGEYLNTLTNEIDFATYPISIYNPNHQMPTSEPEPWRAPHYSEGGYSYDVYKDENGDTSKIWLHQLADGTWIPEPLTASDIIWDPIEQANFVLPNKLLHLNDFILNYSYSWGKSLVQYHPEFCFLKSCYAFENEPEGFALSSEDFDSRLMHTNTFLDAINNGFLSDDLAFIFDENLPINPNPNVGEDWFNPTNNDFTNTDHQWDPFVHLGSEIGDCFDSNTDLETIFNNYKTINGTTYSMPEFAAYMARCSSNPNASPIEGCYNFGGAFNGSYNTSILDQEWRLLRSLYLAEKDKIRARIMECSAMDCSDGMFCGCIGNEDYSLSGAVSQALSSDPHNPCGNQMFGYYQDKERRFQGSISTSSTSESETVNDAVYQYYLATGQCPVPTAVQSIFNKLALEGKLAQSGVLLNDYPEFSSLLVAMNNMQLPSIVSSINHTAQELNANTLELTWKDNLTSEIFAKITLTKNGALTWAEITNFTSINPVSGSVSEFTMTGKKINPADYVVLDQVAITGELEVITFKGCSNFGQDCEGNLLGTDFSQVINQMVLNKKLDTAGVAISLKNFINRDGDTLNLQTKRIEKVVNSTNELFLLRDESNFYIFDSLSGKDNGLIMKQSYITIINDKNETIFLSKLIPLGINRYKIVCYDGEFKPTMEIHGTISVIENGNEVSNVPIGDCYLPTPYNCQTPEHKAFQSLRRVLNDLVENHGSFLESPYLSQELLNQMPFGITSTGGGYNTETDTAIMTYEGCTMTFTVPGSKTITQAKKVLSMEVVGNPDNYGNYHDIRLYSKFELEDEAIAYDYIYGTTCFNLKPCETCIQENESVAAISDKRSSRIDAGLFFEDSTFFEDLVDSAFVIGTDTQLNSNQADSTFIIGTDIQLKYSQYEAFVDSLNVVYAAKNWDQINKLPLTDFAYNGYYLQVDNYIRYGQRHVLNESQKPLYSFQNFVDYIGIGTNVMNEYWRYVKDGVYSYNYKRDTLTQTVLNPITINNFITAKLAKKGDEYAAYLENLDSTIISPLDILTYFSADTVDSTQAGLLYQDYARAYLNFFEKQNSLSNQERCYESMSSYPLLSYEDFIEKNCFCPDSASSVFVNYINQLNDTTSCPGNFPEYLDCATEKTFATKQGTQKLYLEWLRTVEIYNNSYHAIFNENSLQLQKNSFKWFTNSFPKTNTILEYLRYLRPYYQSSEYYNEGKAPVSLEHFYKFGAESVDLNEIDCKAVYNDYIQATRGFNVWAAENNFYEINIVRYEEFINSGACYCIDKYFQNLNYVTQNSENFSVKENFYLFIELSHLCSSDCEVQYKQYQTAINKFNDWAENNEFAFTIENVVSFEDFMKSGACLCIEKFIEKLRYISENPSEFVDNNYFNQYLELSKLCEPSCQDIFVKYQQITQKFNDWAADKDFPYTIPLITNYEDFVSSGACLCIETYAEKLRYIIKNAENFDQENYFSEYTDLTKICDAPCLDAYKKYIEANRRFNDWAKSKGYPFLIKDNLNYQDFIKSGACNCIDLYYDKLMNIVKNPSNFKDKGTFYSYVDLANLCDKTCEDAYKKYLAATKKFNSWAAKNNYPYLIKEIATYEGFMESGACLCIENYFEKLLDIAKKSKEFATEDDFYYFIELSELCDKPCPPDVLDPTDITPAVSTEVTFVDPCVQMAINQATFNAQQNYAAYINNLKTDLFQRYTNHCLGVKENFKYTYDDKTYHFTLYYYDQAGNLIKTIPPAGVSPLDVTEDGVGLSSQIAADRRDNVKTVFTKHRMATTYEYNSLNQLVSQKTPDTDAMNEFALTLPNGLPYQLVTNRIQLLSEKNGYLAGELGARGYLYRTTNGGANWTKVNGIIASDFNKVEMLDAQIGFAVGSKGTVMKTIDGGNTWDWISLMNIPLSSTLPDLYDIDIRGGSSPIITIVGDNNFVAQSTNLTTFNLWNDGVGDGFGDVFSFTLKAIDHDNTGYKITVWSQSFSGIYERDFSATTWTFNQQMKGLGLTHLVEYPEFDEADGQAMRIAFGADGRTYYISKTEPLSRLYSSNLVSKIADVEFFDAFQGIAIQDQQLLRTMDKARNWNVIDNANRYNSLSISNTKNSILAVGEDRLITLIVPFDNYNAERVSIPFNAASVDFEKSWHHYENNQTIAVLSTGGTFYYSWNIASAAPQWHTFAGGFTSSVKSLELRKDGNTIKGFALTNAGDLFEINISGSTGAATPFSGAVASQVKLIKKEVTNPKIAILYSDGTLNSYDPATASETTIYSGLTADYSDMVVEGIDFTLAGATHIDKIILNENSVYELMPYGIFAEKLNDILYDAVNDSWLAVGDDGTIFKHDESNGDWNLQQLQSNYNINQIIHDGTDLYAAGSHGLLGKVEINSGVYSYDFLQLVNGQNIPIAVENDLYDLAINDTKMYAVGTEGIVLYSPDYATVRFGKDFKSDFDLNAIATISGNTHVISVGKNNTIIDHNGVGTLKRQEQYPPALKDVHFSDAVHGTFVGKNGFARTTQDAAMNWEIALPATTPAVDLISVATLLDGSAISASGDGLQFISNGTFSTVSGTETMSHISETAAFGSFAYFVDQDGTTANVYKFDASNQSYSALSSFTGIVNALRILDNGSYALTGNDGLFAYVNEAGTTYLENPTELGNKDFYDIAVLDNMTFILVGKDGAYYHSKEATDDGNGYLQSCAWFQQTGVFDGNTDPYLVDANTEVDIHTIAFGTSTLGVMGGKYNSSFSEYNNPQHCYVRTVYDAPERYSARFYYDKLGRLVVSQNARQYNADQVGENAYKKYSYSLYDALGRVIEAGEKTDNPLPPTGSLNRFRDVFGSYVSDIYNPSVIDDAKLQAWIEGAGERREVTRSYYDKTVIAALPSGFSPNPTTQRKRITHVTYEETFDGNDQTYDHATHYDYDIHGNVKTMLQDNKKMKEQFSSLASQQFKRLDYRYDLVSGNVHRMSVQNGEVDQWHHAYRYDADNRIVEAYTNKNTPLIGLEQASYNLENELNENDDWENDAKYYYYAHGPLARTEIGDKQLQGYDFIYNLQGWMKGVNAIENTNDPGKDGATGVNNSFAKDLTAFSLEYFTSDYQAINSSSPFASVDATSVAASNSSALYNGNIRYMQTRLTNPTTGEAMPMLNAYKYDQLNRLLESRSFESSLSSGVWNPITYDNQYFNSFKYDAMGNILHQDRHLRDGTKIENMTYQYQYEDPTNQQRLMRNRLYHINDDIAYTVNSGDIDDMGTFEDDIEFINQNNNYSYDEEGRLVKDVQEGISKIVWRVDGKVKEIQRVTGDKKWLRFDYDAMGHRIGKHVYSNDGVTHERSTYYVLDAQGNQISTYDHEVVAQNAQFNLKERNIFGSSRIGSKQDSMNVLTATLSQNISQILGLKYYEFSNHLGNVLTVYSDVKIPLDADANSVVDGFGVPIRNTADYSPFGVQLDGRTMQGDFYRRGFNGMEKDDEVKGGGNSYDFGARMYDSRVGRWLTVDPLSHEFPWQSPFNGFDNNPIYFTDPSGQSVESIHLDDKGKVIKNVDDGDNSVFIHKAGTSKNDINNKYTEKDHSAGGIKIGELGKTLNVNKIYKNLLTASIEEAEGIWSPWKFRAKVTDGGVWDLKVQKGTIWGLANDGKTKFLFEGKTMESQDIGNHHFGAVAKASLGYLLNESEILKHCGDNQIANKRSKKEWQPTKEVLVTDIYEHNIKNTYTEKVRLPPYGDDPRDQKWIKAGFKYYKNHH